MLWAESLLCIGRTSKLLLCVFSSFETWAKIQTALCNRAHARCGTSLPALLADEGCIKRRICGCGIGYHLQRYDVSRVEAARKSEGLRRTRSRMGIENWANCERLHTRIREQLH